MFSPSASSRDLEISRDRSDAETHSDRRSVDIPMSSSRSGSLLTARASSRALMTMQLECGMQRWGISDSSEGHIDLITSVTLSPDSKRVVSESGDGTVQNSNTHSKFSGRLPTDKRNDLAVFSDSSQIDDNGWIVGEHI